MIHAFAEADDSAKIFSAKWDVLDGFWQMVCEEGQEWNFAYVLPQPDGVPPVLVVPTSLQMGWIESPPYFCAASETGRDVAVQHMERPVGSLPMHKYQHLTEGAAEFDALPDGGGGDRLQYVVEVYVDDFMALAIPANKEQLRHVSTAVMTGIHEVFLPADEDGRDSISHKKLKKGEGTWSLVKDLLGFEFDGDEFQHTMWLEEGKRAKILTTLAE